MNSLVDLVVFTLATSHVVEVWHHGEIFRGCREAVKFCKWEWLSYLSQCMFCLSLWIATLVCLFSFVPIVGTFLIWSLAIARGSNLLNDLTYAFNRTPKDDKDSFDDNGRTSDEFTAEAVGQRREGHS